MMTNTTNSNISFIFDSALDGLYIMGNIIILNFIVRIILFFKEFIYYKNHYPSEHRLLHILKFTFFYNWKSYVLFLIFPIIFNMSYQDGNFEKNVVRNFILAIIALMLYEGAKINENKLQLANFIRSGKGLDYGTGMASNYFHGYLHLQLPDHGDNLKGFTERMQDYESNEQIEFAVKKLFILIPHSLQTKPKIQSKILQKVKPLETMIKGRAGVERPFKNDVYRFTEKINGRIYYIAMEGATPLLSYFEAMTNKLTGTIEMEEMSREILFKFYECIKKFTQGCAGTRNEVEIVYYQDIVNNRDIDVGVVLKHRIEEMLKDN